MAETDRQIYDPEKFASTFADIGRAFAIALNTAIAAFSQLSETLAKADQTHLERLAIMGWAAQNCPEQLNRHLHSKKRRVRKKYWNRIKRMYEEEKK